MDDEKFVYVFSKKARDEMLKLGYILISSDKDCGRFIFENNPKLTFDLMKENAIKSNTLTF